MTPAQASTGISDGARITPIGTCRIFHPLRLRAALDGRFRFDQSATYGYVHSSGEIVQQARFLAGDRAIPAEIWPLVSERPHCLPGEDARADASVYVVEVSSLKDIRYGDWRLKGSRLDDALGDRALSRIFWRHGAEEARGARLEQLRGVAGYHALDDFMQDVVRESFVVRQGAAEVRRDLAVLQAILPRFLIVTHCDVIGHDGRPIADRRTGIETVRAASRALGIAVFEPAEVLARWRQDEALPIFGVDTSHYTTPFARDVGAALIDRITGETTRAGVDRPSMPTPVANGVEATARDHAIEARIGAWCDGGAPIDPAELADTTVYRLVAAVLIDGDDGDGLVTALRLALGDESGPGAFVAELARRAMAADRLRPAVRLFAAVVNFPAHRLVAGRGLMELYRIAVRRLGACRDDAAIVEHAALVLSLNPDRTTALCAAAQALERLGRVEEAIVYWDRLCDNEPELDRWRVSASRARRRIARAAWMRDRPRR